MRASSGEAESSTKPLSPMLALISDSSEGNCPRPTGPLRHDRIIPGDFLQKQFQRTRRGGDANNVEQSVWVQGRADLRRPYQAGECPLIPPSGRLPLTPLRSVRHSVVSSSRAFACGSQSEGVIAFGLFPPQRTSRLPR